MTRLAFIIFWGLTLIAGRQLVTIRQQLSLGQTDLITKVLGESRVLMGARMIQKGDIYFHGGIEAEGSCEGLQSNPHEHTDSCGHNHTGDCDHSEMDHDESQEDSYTDTDAAYSGAGWYRKIMQEVRPTGHTHLTSKREVTEILPWIRLAADLDPHNVDAYDVGAYWLANKVKAPAKAVEFLNEGIAHNPTSFKLELAKGELLMYTDPVAADSALAKAEKKWVDLVKYKQGGNELPETMTDPEPIYMERIQVFRARCMLNLGRREQAIVFYQRALKVSQNKESIRQRIQQLMAKGSRKSAPPPSEEE